MQYLQDNEESITFDKLSEVLGLTKQIVKLYLSNYRFEKYRRRIPYSIQHKFIFDNSFILDLYNYLSNKKLFDKIDRLKSFLGVNKCRELF